MRESTDDYFLYISLCVSVYVSVYYKFWIKGKSVCHKIHNVSFRASLVCCSPWGHKESDTSEHLNWTELVAQMVENLPAMKETCGFGRFPWERKGYRSFSALLKLWICGVFGTHTSPWKLTDPFLDFYLYLLPKHMVIDRYL